MSKTLINISTKTGDAGSSGLANGTRLSKTDSAFKLIGELDELNSWIGLVLAKLKQDKLPESALLKEQLMVLMSAQDWLYQVSALVALAPKFSLASDFLTQLEAQSTQLQEAMAPNWHQHFLYPGGSELGGWLDILRTVARRVERGFWEWQEKVDTSSLLPVSVEALPQLGQTLNRISDYFYLLRCYVNELQHVAEREFRKPTES